MIDLKHIHPRLVNDKIVRLSEDDNDLAMICTLLQAHQVLPGLGYRALGIGFEGLVGFYLCNSATVPEPVHRLCEDVAVHHPGVYAYMHLTQTPPAEMEDFFSCEIVYRYLQALLAVLKVGEVIEV